jgi:chromosome segregation ATPase
MEIEEIKTGIIERDEQLDSMQEYIGKANRSIKRLEELNAGLVSQVSFAEAELNQLKVRFIPLEDKLREYELVIEGQRVRMDELNAEIRRLMDINARL